ncbi:MAG: amidohydrolase [Nitrososphaerota archaeon]
MRRKSIKNGKTKIVALVNGRIFSFPNIKKSFEALIIKNEKIIYIGSNKEVLRKINKIKNVKIIDLKGKTVLPGLIDTHIHLSSLGTLLKQINLRNISSIKELVKKIKLEAKSKPGKLIIGIGWDQEKFKEKRFPTRWDLDKASKNNPILIIRVCGHLGVVNSFILNKLNLEKFYEKYKQYVEFDEKGECIGIFKEKALEELLNKLLKYSVKEIEEILSIAIKEALKNGLTCIHFLSCEPIEFEALKNLLKKGKLPIRIRAYIDAKYIDSISKPLGINDKLKLMGIKILLDGSLGARTARLYEPYSDNPKTRGTLLYNEEELKILLLKAKKRKLQLAIHVIGDEAIDKALNIIKKIYGKKAKDFRIRIEHASLLNKEIIEKIKKIGIIASIQPHFVISDFWAVKRLGEKRSKYLYPFKTLFKKGIVLTGGSDCPVEPINPFSGIYAAVTRGRNEKIELYKYTKNEKLKLEEAIKLYTINAAYASFDENNIGSLEKGKYADFIVLSENPFEKNIEKMKDMKIEKVFINGEIVYE